MSDEQNTQQPGSGDITVGNISGSKGIAIGHGAQAMVNERANSDDPFAQRFAEVYQKIVDRPADENVDKDEITSEVQQIETEAKKGDDANKTKLRRWFRNLAEMAPDIFDVTVAALTGPHAAFATVAQKVAAKAKQERE
jgi:stalled ribosome rescue protein Dom34